MLHKVENATQMQHVRALCRCIEESIEETDVGDRVRCRFVFRNLNR